LYRHRNEGVSNLDQFHLALFDILELLLNSRALLNETFIFSWREAGVILRVFHIDPAFDAELKEVEIFLFLFEFFDHFVEYCTHQFLLLVEVTVKI